jgi:hypothetical protein
MMRWLLCCVVGVASLIFCAVCASADPITFTYTARVAEVNGTLPFFTTPIAVGDLVRGTVTVDSFIGQPTRGILDDPSQEITPGLVRYIQHPGGMTVQVVGRGSAAIPLAGMSEPLTEVFVSSRDQATVLMLAQSSDDRFGENRFVQSSLFFGAFSNVLSSTAIPIDAQAYQHFDFGRFLFAESIKYGFPSEGPFLGFSGPVLSFANTASSTPTPEPTPEPATLFLVGAGLTAAGAGRRLYPSHAAACCRRTKLETTLESPGST